MRYERKKKKKKKEEECRCGDSKGVGGGEGGEGGEDEEYSKHRRSKKRCKKKLVIERSLIHTFGHHVSIKVPGSPSF
jgi:hypothetical protein